MAGLLVPVVFVLGCLAALAGRDRLGFGRSIREAVLASATACAGFVWLTLELLGTADAVRPWPVRGCWVAAAMALAAFAWVNRRKLTPDRTDSSFFLPSPLGGEGSGVRGPRLRHTGGVPESATPAPHPAAKRGHPLPQGERVKQHGYAAVCAAVLLWTGLVAALVPTTNIDSLVYHLPRQLQWVQAGNVAHFPAQDYRLTVNPPFAEFCGLTLWELTGGDRWANVPQWAALGLTMVAVSLIAREIGAPASGQWLAAALVATLPIAFQQAASPKNDLTAACWLAVTAFWSLRAWTASEITFAQAVLAGLSVGLLVLTKGTGAAFGAPVVALGLVGLLTHRPRGWVIGLVAMAAIIPAMNAGHWKRNVAAYGTISGETFGLGNEAHGIAVTASNLIRNAAGQMVLPAAVWNDALRSAVERLHERIGQPTNDPPTTWQTSLPFAVEYNPASWELAAAPVHAVLAGLALVVIPLSAVMPRGGLRILALLAAGGAVLAFCAAFKWQPSNARLLLPAQVLFAAPAAWVLSLPGLRWLGPLSILAAGAVLVPIVEKNARELPGWGRPWAERWTPEARYGPFADAAYLGRLTAGRVQLLRPASVGIVNNTVSGMEYPVARTIQQWVVPAPRIGYFYPVPEVPDPAPAPDAVIDFSGDSAPRVIRHPGSGRVYHLTDRIGLFSVYQPLAPGQEATGTGYRLTPDGGWEPVGVPPPAGPPTGTQSVARFGVRIEPPNPGQ